MGLSKNSKVVITMAVVMEEDEFNHVLRILGTNVEGKEKTPYALTKIRGIGRRFSFQICKAADVDVNKRAGELTKEEVEEILKVIEDPGKFKIPQWFMNRKRDLVTGETKQMLSNPLDMCLREDLNRLKKNKISSWYSSLLGINCTWT